MHEHPQHRADERPADQMQNEPLTIGEDRVHGLGLDLDAAHHHEATQYQPVARAL